MNLSSKKWNYYCIANKNNLAKDYNQKIITDKKGNCLGIIIEIEENILYMCAPENKELCGYVISDYKVNSDYKVKEDSNEN